jgi:HK97 family phage major capsid protein
MPPENAIATLGWVARAAGIANKSYRGAAEDWLLASGAPERVQRIVKSPIGAGTTTDSDLGAYGISIGTWSDSLRTRSVFYRLLADSAFTRAPVRTRVGMMTSTATGAMVPEGESVPVSRATLANILLAPTKVSALIVVTDTLLHDVSAAGQSLFNRELGGAISDAVDAAFLAMIVSTSTTSNASTGTQAVDAKHDLRTALLSVPAVGNAKLYWVCAPDVAKRASTLEGGGLDAFPAMSATGGEMANLPAIVSSGVPSGELYLVDASGIAADGGPATVGASNQAAILMDTAPVMSSATPTPAQMISMFQTNSTALKADAWIAAQVLRDDAVAVVTGITWGG